MTGVELHRHLIETGHTIPTILVTAYPNDSDQKHMLTEGVECYLRKPFEEADLIGCLRCAFARGSTMERVR
jgi:CheY-like chemotaxis protein